MANRHKEIGNGGGCLGTMGSQGWASIVRGNGDGGRRHEGEDERYEEGQHTVDGEERGGRYEWK